MSIGSNINNTNNREERINKDSGADNKDCTINKSMLINWLASGDEEISVTELGMLIESKTNGKYSLVKKNKKPDTVSSD